MITQVNKDIIISALDMKLASIKRAKNTNKNPKFTPVYDAEENETMGALAYIRGLAIDKK